MYSVEIKETSTELTKKQRIAIKDTTDCIKLDEATAESSIIIKPIAYAVLSVHNDKAENPDYELYVVVADDGQKYVTGSKSFFSSFMSIYEEMYDVEDEDWSIKIFRSPSKNYKGKDFITCSIF